MRAVLGTAFARLPGPLAAQGPALLRSYAIPTDSKHQQVAPSGAPGDAPPAQQMEGSAIAEMNPNVHPTARDANDYTQVMEEAYKLSQAAATATPFGEVGVASGVPADLRAERRATIMAAGWSRVSNAPKWSVRFNPLQKWMNQTMGWTATGDPMEACPEACLWFYSKEQAMRFCERQGWRYTVEPEQAATHGRQRRFAGYGDNFTVKRGGVPDLTHLPSNTAAAGERGPAAAQQAGRPGAGGAGPTARHAGEARPRG